MALSIGIVGLPNVGKSTLFNALTQKAVPAENYPFCTIDPSVGVVAVPDARLDALANLSGSEKVIPAAIEFVDIAGLVAGASKGEGLGNQFLSHIREVDAILHLVRLFDSGEKTGKDPIHHVYGSVDPARDIEVITMELILADLSSVQKRREKLARDVKRGDKPAMAEDVVLAKYQDTLEEEQPARALQLTEEEQKLAVNVHLLTTKPVLFGFNKRAQDTNYDETNQAEFAQLLETITKQGNQYVVLDARTEHELSEFDKDERGELRAELGSEADDTDMLIRRCYHLLGLISYLTTGPKETRAWTIKKQTAAPQAAAAIHTDFEKGFIRAQVIGFDELIDATSMTAAKAAGKVRTEGKDYVVADGDVIEFLVN